LSARFAFDKSFIDGVFGSYASDILVFGDLGNYDCFSSSLLAQSALCFAVLHGQRCKVRTTT
jgi:hypothetical protein